LTTHLMVAFSSPFVC